MAFTLTTNTITGNSGLSETVIVVQDNNSTATNEQPTAIAVDYSAYFSRLATAAEAVQASIANIETSIANIEDDINRLRELGDPEFGGPSEKLGIRVTEPYKMLTYALIWKSIVLEKDATDITNPSSSSDQDAAAEKLRDWISAFESKFPEFR